MAQKFGELLKTFRKRRGITLEEMAYMLQHTKTYIHLLEKGTALPPSYEKTKIIINILKLSDMEKKQLLGLAFRDRIKKDKNYYQELHPELKLD